MARDVFCPLTPRKKYIDEEYFEVLTAVVFQMIIGPEVTNRHWHEIRKSFYNFSLNRVSRMGESDIQTLMANPNIIRNRKKIAATILNARHFLEIKKNYGSFEKYLEHFYPHYADLVTDISGWVKYIGRPSVEIFLGCFEISPATWHK